MPTFAYRRDLGKRELIPALGAGVGVGLVVAYLTQLMLRKETIPRRPGGAAAGSPRSVAPR